MVKVIKLPKILKIYIDGTLHLYIFGYLVGIQSWISESGYYKIEFYTETQVIKTEYVNKDIWKEILKKINIELNKIK